MERWCRPPMLNSQRFGKRPPAMFAVLPFGSWRSTIRCVLDFGPEYNRRRHEWRNCHRAAAAGRDALWRSSYQVNEDGNDLGAFEGSICRSASGTYTGWNLGRRDRLRGCLLLAHGQLHSVRAHEAGAARCGRLTPVHRRALPKYSKLCCRRAQGGGAACRGPPALAPGRQPFSRGGREAKDYAWPPRCRLSPGEKMPDGLRRAAEAAAVSLRVPRTNRGAEMSLGEHPPSGSNKWCCYRSGKVRLEADALWGNQSRKIALARRVACPIGLSHPYARSCSGGSPRHPAKVLSDQGSARALPPRGVPA